MPSIIGGIIAISLGVWGLSVYWWSIAELLRGLLPLLLIVGGLVALSAGVQMLREKTTGQENNK
ncbi:hypothetical protein LCGC14_2350160 [marine sediment metagenome]|uniref:Magnetosome protein MamI n=1 Tax=marine sediment metagenome TaxID=412755 RepID=A0A0F9EM49_9ZZZZ|nr:hypothetical protein [Candidatus Scalindua sediminis]HDY67698.1 hypothetical protein [Candidatus Scalindua sp.]